MLKKLLREPLLHFLLLGGLLFLLNGYVNNDKSVAEDEREVRVDKERLLTYLQYRNKKFDPNSAEQKLADLTEGQLQSLIAAYVREEVLYREALALKLDQNDYVIRRRLTQKLEFITQGFMEKAEITEQQVAKYFAENQEDYYISPSITFTHVYFDAERHGWDKAKEMADAQLRALRQSRATFSDAIKYGDRFLYYLNYVERVPDFVASHFGKDMMQKLFALPADNNTWQGPFRSDYGYHLVMVEDRQEGRSPDLKEIYGRVEDDARRALLRENVDKAIDKLIAGYQVNILYQPTEAKLTSHVAAVEAK